MMSNDYDLLMTTDSADALATAWQSHRCNLAVEVYGMVRISYAYIGTPDYKIGMLVTMPDTMDAADVEDFLRDIGNRYRMRQSHNIDRARDALKQWVVERCG